MVQGENSGSRRRNKRRGKGRSQAAQSQSARAVNGHDRSDSSSSSPAAHKTGRAGIATVSSRSFLSNLVMDLSPYMYNMSRLQDAEVKFYSSKPSEEKTAPASEDVDLFASDEEAAEVPARVKPAPKPKAAPKKAEAAPKVVEAPAWPNKAECNDAEAKFQAELSKLLKTDVKEEFYHPSLCFPHGPVDPPTKRPSSARRKKNDGSQNGPSPPTAQLGLSEQIARARDHIKNSLECVDTLVTGLSSSEEMALVKKLNALEVENKQLKKVTDDLKALVLSLEARVGSLEGGKPAAKAAPAAPAPAADDDDDVDLFGSDDEDEDEEKKRITEERLKAYHEKKAKKTQVIAKTSVLFDVKPWDDETDHAEMLKACKSIEMDGLLWGASKLVPIGYGIKKLQIMCVVEDAKVSIEELGEKMEAFEDFVQSVDVAAMNKI